MNRLREEWFDAVDLFWMLWWHGTFPLRFVVYGTCGALLIGFLLGRLA